MKKTGKRIALLLGALLLAPVAVVGLLLLLNFRTPCPTDAGRRLPVGNAAPWRSPAVIRLATMNVWGVPYQCPYHAERMPAIGRALAKEHPDIVGFEEAFVGADRRALLAPLEKEGLHHHRYFRSGLVGSGLFVVSRWPIVTAFFHRYAKGGKPWRVDHGDWWAGKGVCFVRLRLPPDGRVLDLFVTHAHARYRDDHYDAVRMSNMEELAGFVRRAAPGTVPAFVIGDFNVRPEEPQYKALVERARLERLMRVKSRIDHIFALRTPQYRFQVLATVSIRERIPLDSGGSTRLSDHPGYVTTLRIVPEG